MATNIYDWPCPDRHKGCGCAYCTNHSTWSSPQHQWVTHGPYGGEGPIHADAEPGPGDWCSACEETFTEEHMSAYDLCPEG